MRDFASEKNKWNTGLALTLLGSATWGMEMLCRTSFSYYLEDINFTASMAGTVNFVTAVAFFFSTMFFSRLADRKNCHGRMLVICLLGTGFVTGLLSAASGFGWFVFLRFLFGIVCGPIYALLTAIISRISTQEKYSRNIGIVANGESIINTVLGPTVVVALLGMSGWRRTNIYLSLPVAGLALFWLGQLKKIPSVKEEISGEGVKCAGSLSEILQIRNVWLSVLSGAASLVGVWTIYTYGPIYWKTEAGLSDVFMSRVMSLMGVLMAVWLVVLPEISNRRGRKPVVILFNILAAITFGIMYLVPQAPFAIWVFVLLGGSCSALSVFFMAMIPGESVSKENCATAASIANGGSELLGGAVGTLLAGIIADVFGMKYVMLFAAICISISGVLDCFLKETAGYRVIK